MPESSDVLPTHIQSIRRSATLPTRLHLRKQPSSEFLRTTASENDLFFHPSAKIVHFSPRALAPIPSSTAPADFDYPVDTIETLPWRSATERTVACAPLRLEKVHGLTVFLKCGSVVHAILKNSQCWCVDGESTFVLRIRPLTYYRIELSNETEEDKKLVAAMKEALSKVLRYEVTPCPFKRGFTVELPEEAKAPRRKRAWRPKGRRESAPVRSMSVLENASAAEDLTLLNTSAGEDTDGNTTDDSGFTTKDSNSTILETVPDDEEAPSSATVPGVLPLSTSSVAETQQSFETLLARFEEASDLQVGPDMSYSSSFESFHSIEIPPSPAAEIHSPLTTASPLSVACPDKFPEQQECLAEDMAFHLPDSSEKKSFSAAERGNRTASQAETLPMDQSSGSSSTSFLDIPSSAETDLARNLSDMSIEFRRRSKASREREISPMPPPSILVSSSPPEKQDAASIIQKTATLVLVPPVQLFILLIHIAARIVLGPALNSAMGDFSRKLEYHAANSQEAVDDYDIPIAPDRRTATGSDVAKKLDPWDLD
ncbi:hypothetical protein IFM58399_02332 [Aspergillus lentulus]|uniref:Inheritance of peroxisomes protein 1 n=1 Tax=Aspergillus lentulus TaxID=293939 RepID=A0ABQ0ZTR2_ASPLE|nr:uncharacterized protein IFM58399_02332 [Aspergillus lentulus]GFF29645.1 hypothetical protein IFM58399_02332 [Aspergillus lentulus]GFF64171.1 hypothetical protein IFM60648_01173 [Aspergillus lentulus]GFF67949.1 hypothetical protein IFM47457_01898 [Aspergillus lentulus]GFF99037.1 hypothetical protein IFM61392_00611 [Aspergillus lentulus]